MSKTKNKFEAFLMDKTTHKCILSVEFTSDGYVAALADAYKLCTEQHPNLYVGKLIKVE